MAGLLHGDHGSRLERFSGSRQDRAQPLDDVGRSRVAQPEDHDADRALAAECGDLPEVEVEGQDRSSL
jgi:hypothetical protein